MGEPLPRAGTHEAPLDSGSSATPEQSLAVQPEYIPYRPPNSEFTPPASPQPLNVYATKKSFGSSRPRHPARLQTDASSTAPAYERPVYSPSPSSSPPLPPALPSPKFPSRQRAPSLLRHAAVSSPLNDGFPRAEQPASSPVLAPSMLRQGSGTGVTSDPRSFFNPLASNPVNQNGPTWDSSSEDLSGPAAQQRARGMTSSSQTSFQPHPPLRAATSIPDYGPFRTGERPNLSGAYRPNRGNANWSHNDHYPLRHFRGEEPRASFRSIWTNASSSFMEASGTERSSMATGRSSISEHRESTYSRDRSDEERDLSPETTHITEATDDDDIVSAVEDVIDAYCHEEGIGIGGGHSEETNHHLSTSPLALDSDIPDLTHTPSQEADSGRSHTSSIQSRHLDVRPLSYMEEHRNGVKEVDSFSLDMKDGNAPSPYLHVSADDANEPRNLQTTQLPLPFSPVDVQYSALKTAPPTKTRHDTPLLSQTSGQRSSEEIPRRTSRPVQALLNGHFESNSQECSSIGRYEDPKPFNKDRQHIQNIHRDLCDLPQLPKKKSRISRQDWADIEAYSKRTSQRPGYSRQNTNDSSSGIPKIDPVLPSSPPKQSDPLPEVDEDDAIPRRASTSVFDRKSTLFDLRKPLPTTPRKSNMLESADAPTSARLQQPGLSLGRTPSAVERDRYGFKKATDKIGVQEYDAWFNRYDEYVTRRRNKWKALMAKNGLSTNDPTKFPDRCEKVKRYARKGYPPEWRGAMWWYYSGGQYKAGEPDMRGLYPSLVARVNQGDLNKDDREAIERDLDRTFPDNVHFRPDLAVEKPDGTAEETPLIKDLREVLSCFALHNPSIGYCQSLNFIAGLLLLFLKQDNEKAFILLTIITQNHLPGAHARSLANTEVNVLMMLIRDYLPKVWASINDTDLINSGPGSHAHPDSKFQRQPTVALSCTSWFMSIFVGVLPIETVLRVWDAFLYDGPRALYRYALAIFKLGEGEIRKYRPGDGELFMAVQNLPRGCLDPNILHDIAFVKKGFGSLTQNVIDQKRLFWRDQNDRARKASAAPEGDKDSIQTQEKDDDTESRRGIHGLRRKASKRFNLKKRG